MTPTCNAWICYENSLESIPVGTNCFWHWHQSYLWVYITDWKEVTYWCFRKSYLNKIGAFTHKLTSIGFRAAEWLSLCPLICLFLSLGYDAFGFWAWFGCPPDTRAAFCQCFDVSDKGLHFVSRAIHTKQFWSNQVPFVSEAILRSGEVLLLMVWCSCKMIMSLGSSFSVVPPTPPLWKSVWIRAGHTKSYWEGEQNEEAPVS